jgi:type IV pilus assembly protein PilY1
MRKMNRARTPAVKTLLCAALAAQVLQPVTAYAQTVPAIADEPLYTATSIQPNVMLTLDNSGSMAWQFAPMSTASNVSRRCFTSHLYNKLYYNPSMTYRPPVMADGVSRYPNSSYTDAWRDGFDTSAGTLDLSSRFPGVGNYAAETKSNSNTNPAIGSSPVGGAYYHEYTGSSPATPAEDTCYSDSRYTKVEMNLATAEQKTNFANWFSYYRTRINAMKTSAGEAFRVVDGSFRVGLHTINEPDANGSDGAFIGLSTFTGSHRSNWYSRFYQLLPSGGTPLRAAHQRVGEYYQSGKSPGGGATPDPIIHSCQQTC